MDKAYPTLDGVAQQQLELQRYLENDQVAFSVRQRKPTTIEAAVGATLECESYLVRPTHSDSVVVPVQIESKQEGGGDDTANALDGQVGGKFEASIFKARFCGEDVLRSGEVKSSGMLPSWSGRTLRMWLCSG